MERFEASQSIPNTGTGARREGEAFEHLVAELWVAFRQVAESGGARVSVVPGPRTRRYAKLTVGPRSLYIPAPIASQLSDPAAGTPRWLEVVYDVSELVASYPGATEAIHRYSPDTGPYAGSSYPGIYSGLTIRFDDTVVLEEGGVLRDKILIEYKTAKSSARRQIDGNAHERLSFQIMQYLEVATRYTRCSFVVIANSAFIRYRNKYHVNFHIQADRLANFAWFTMEYACFAAQYSRFLSGLLAWLFSGKTRNEETAP
ncbi:MAG: hypothetical protein FJZ90_03125 [Chloroflexi bacterium]|nr:hypothetical protein [Chloroflexota bacterium]